MREPFKVVCWWDPAIDTEACNVSEYRAKRDFDSLKFVPGMRPTIYYLRDASSTAVNRYILGAPAEEQIERAFRMSVIRVDGMLRQNGVVQDGWESRRFAAAKGEARIADTYDLFDESELAEFDVCDQQEIGLVARTRFFSSRKIAPHYPLPDMSLQIFVTRMSLLAEQASRTAADGKSESPPPGGAATTT